jgi:hypothetical protein
VKLTPCGPRPKARDPAPRAATSVRAPYPVAALGMVEEEPAAIVAFALPHYSPLIPFNQQFDCTRREGAADVLKFAKRQRPGKPAFRAREPLPRSPLPRNRLHDLQRSGRVSAPQILGDKDLVDRFSQRHRLINQCARRSGSADALARKPATAAPLSIAVRSPSTSRSSKQCRKSGPHRRILRMTEAKARRPASRWRGAGRGRGGRRWGGGRAR